MNQLKHLSTYSAPQLQQMLVETQRALQLIGANPKTPLRVIASYQLDGDEILTIESDLPHALVAHELRGIVNQLKAELQLP